MARPGRGGHGRGKPAPPQPGEPGNRSDDEGNAQANNHALGELVHATDAALPESPGSGGSRKCNPARPTNAPAPRRNRTASRPRPPRSSQRPVVPAKEPAARMGRHCPRAKRAARVRPQTKAPSPVRTSRLAIQPCTANNVWSSTPAPLPGQETVQDVGHGLFVKNPLVARRFLARLVAENLGGDDLQPELARLVAVFPDIYKDDGRPAGVPGLGRGQRRLHHLPGHAGLGPEIDHGGHAGDERGRDVPGPGRDGGSQDQRRQQDGQPAVPIGFWATKPTARFASKLFPAIRAVGLGVFRPVPGHAAPERGRGG